MECQPGLDECFCYKCHRPIQQGEYKLRVKLYVEEVITGETEGRMEKMTQLPSLCESCAQGVLRETEVETNPFIFPWVGEPTLYSN